MRDWEITLVVILCVLALPLGLLLWLQFYIAESFYSIAEDKGYDSRKFFHLTFWFGLVGMLMVIALPNKRAVAVSTPHVQSSVPIDELPDL